jgi:hypothetical protein
MFHKQRTIEALFEERELACIIMGKRERAFFDILQNRRHCLLLSPQKTPNYLVHKTTNGQTIDKKALR